MGYKYRSKLLATIQVLGQSNEKRIKQKKAMHESSSSAAPKEENIVIREAVWAGRNVENSL